MTKYWIIEWPIDNVDLTCKKVRELIKLGEQQVDDPEWQSRLPKFRNTPWVKLICPHKDQYHLATESDPTDDEIESLAGAKDPYFFYTWKLSGRTAYNSIYIDMIESVFDTPPGKYVYDDKPNVMVFSYDLKRVGCLASTLVD